jgi:hypothetical protein
LKDIDKLNAELDLRFPGEGTELDGEKGKAINLSIGADFEPVDFD